MITVRRHRASTPTVWHIAPRSRPALADASSCAEDASGRAFEAANEPEVIRRPKTPWGGAWALRRQVVDDLREEGGHGAAWVDAPGRAAKKAAKRAAKKSASE